jgi:hypothetical protein
MELDTKRPRVDEETRREKEWKDMRTWCFRVCDECRITLAELLVRLNFSHACSSYIHMDHAPPETDKYAREFLIRIQEEMLCFDQNTLKPDGHMQVVEDRFMRYRKEFTTAGGLNAEFEEHDGKIIVRVVMYAEYDQVQMTDLFLRNVCDQIELKFIEVESCLISIREL